jgi:hypothetical protein
VDSISIAVEHLKLFGIEPGFLNELGGTESVLEGGATVQISHSDLDECPEVPRRPVRELHDAAGLSLKKNHVAPSNVSCLHRVRAPVD